jgi:hypothetical protein
MHACKELIKQLEPLMELAYVEYPNIWVKALFETARLDFTIMGWCPPILRAGAIDIKDCKTKRITGRCYLDLVDCTDVEKEKAYQILCPQCLENYISRSIINQIDKIIRKSIGDSNVSVSRFNPIE